MNTKAIVHKAWESEQWDAHIGQQVRHARLEEDASQAQLAERANVALGALKNLEAGRASTLRALVRVVRALGLEERLDELSPDPGISPMSMLRAARKSAPPKRASGSRRAKS